MTQEEAAKRLKAAARFANIMFRMPVKKDPSPTKQQLAKEAELRRRGISLLSGPAEKEEQPTPAGPVPLVLNLDEGTTKRIATDQVTPGFTNLSQAVWAAQGSTIRTSDPVPREGPRDRDFSDGTTVRVKTED